MFLNPGPEIVVSEVVCPDIVLSRNDLHSLASLKAEAIAIGSVCMYLCIYVCMYVSGQLNSRLGEPISFKRGTPIGSGDGTK